MTPEFIEPVPLAGQEEMVPPIKHGADLKAQLKEAKMREGEDIAPYPLGEAKFNFTPQEPVKEPFKAQPPPTEPFLERLEAERAATEKRGRRHRGSTSDMPKTMPGKKGLTEKELRARYQDMYGKPAPKRMRKAALSQAVFGQATKEEL
jgi:hypothetical protein